ncbi:hypothetical protein BDQ94DRAFT_164422 [Aspergillus welwitschiae]|uniref:Uncharacterized protein n=1 Tax=Aspergillus welwitschiae TaxID=1341132 RepID=A0A3F3PHS5_9EURO|nr:hypothetical protein BDQ94DRAFT_164422 [Aspergillus welwitschiae]RDH26505.1 hypothetical protein BDQ94DRAFT_164422 [Aspergillus welwitschiae]
MKHNNSGQRKSEASQQEWERVAMDDEIGHARRNNNRPGTRPAGPPYTDRSIGWLGRGCGSDPKFGSHGSVVCLELPCYSSSGPQSGSFVLSTWFLAIPIAVYSHGRFHPFSQAAGPNGCFLPPDAADRPPSVLHGEFIPYSSGSQVSLPPV